MKLQISATPHYPVQYARVFFFQFLTKALVLQMLWYRLIEYQIQETSEKAIALVTRHWQIVEVEYLPWHIGYCELLATRIIVTSFAHYSSPVLDYFG